MGVNGNINLDDGVSLETVEVTTIELTEGQAALLTYPGGVTLAIPEASDEESFIPQHIMFLIGVYFMSLDDAFVEKMIRTGINKMKEAEALSEGDVKFDD